MAPFLLKPDVVTSSMSGSIELLNSSERNAGSPITMCEQGPIFIILSQTYFKREYKSLHYVENMLSIVPRINTYKIVVKCTLKQMFETNAV